MAFTSFPKSADMAALEARICASLDRMGLQVESITHVERAKQEAKQQYFLAGYDDQGAVMCQTEGAAQVDTTLGNWYRDTAQKAFNAGLLGAAAGFDPMRKERERLAAEQQLAFKELMTAKVDAATCVNKVETEDEMLERLLKAKGLKAVAVKDAVHPITEFVGETVSPAKPSTPRGLTMVSALGGTRMGAAAWQAE